MIDYDLNEQLADREGLDQLKNMGIDLKLDFILNHASAQSPQFQDLVEKGEASVYRDFFIDWNHFWEGHGTMTEEGYIQPDESLSLIHIFLYSFFKTMWEIVSVLRLLLQQLPV